MSSPNMALTIPTVGVTDGPTYANQINACLTLIDQHDHTDGHGVPITPQALNIDDDVSFQGHNLTELNAGKFSAQGSADTGIKGSLQMVGDDLYFIDGVGNSVRITILGSVAGTPGSIADLLAPASATYLALSSKFVFQSNIDTPAHLDGASLILRNLIANSKALTLSPPNAMSSNYDITLPALPTVADSYVIMSPTGVMTTLNRGAVYDAGSSGASKTLDWVNSPAQKLLLTAACVLTLDNPVNGESYMLLLTRSGGSWAVTWPGNVKWANGVVPPPSAAGQTDIINLFYDGTNYYGTGASNFS